MQNCKISKINSSSTLFTLKVTTFVTSHYYISETFLLILKHCALYKLTFWLLYCKVSTFCSEFEVIIALVTTSKGLLSTWTKIPKMQNVVFHFFIMSHFLYFTSCCLNCEWLRRRLGSHARVCVNWRRCDAAVRACYRPHPPQEFGFHAQGPNSWHSLERRQSPH